MRKKLLIASLFFCFNFITNAHADEATLQIVNQTTVESGWLSVAQLVVNGKAYSVCSQGFSDDCASTITIPIPANINFAVSLYEFLFGNGHLSPSNISEECRHIPIGANSGETKTILISGNPSNNINWNSEIVCTILN